jgi:activator of HSP90 ATPase
MTPVAVSRRAFSASAATFAAALGVVRPARSAQAESAAPPAGALGISATNAAIHQEVVFNASPARVYHALTDPREFDKIVLLSGAVQAMALKNTPAEISSAPGGPFAVFGGYITGRQLELLPNTRIIQVWHSASWPPHIYSIARFELSEHPDGTKLLFDHTGFPSSDAASLATGWQQHYWEPLAKVLA